MRRTTIAYTLSITILIILPAAFVIGTELMLRHERLNRDLIRLLYVQNDKPADSTAVYKLLAAGADPNSPEPLQEDRAWWQQIIDRMERRGTENQSARRALEIAIEHQDRISVSALLERGADPDTAITLGRSMIAKAMALGDRQLIVPLLLDAGATDVNGKDTGSTGSEATGSTLFMQWNFAEPQFACKAVIDNNLEDLEALLKHGADPNSREDNGRTALQWAVFHANISAVRTLIEHHADVNATDNEGKSVLQSAREVKRKLELADVDAIIGLLTRAGAREATERRLK
jgi:ankyrin repeat protein